VAGCNIQRVEGGFRTIAEAEAHCTTAGSLLVLRHKGELRAQEGHSSPSVAARPDSSCWEDRRNPEMEMRRVSVYPPIDQGEPKWGEDRLGAQSDVLQSVLREVQAGAPMMSAEGSLECLHSTRCGSLDHTPQSTLVATLACRD